METTIIEPKADIEKLSFPKDRPVCCGKTMYAAGGSLGPINENSLRFWRCEICGKETEDLPS